MGLVHPLSVLNSLLLPVLFFHAGIAAPLQNITLPLPAGTSNHGSPGLLCTPAHWLDILSFYFLNYIVHATTVLTKPGERSWDYSVTVIGSLFFPTIGLHRGVTAVLSGAIFERRKLAKAAKSGALCMLVRAPDWRPADGDGFHNAVLHRAPPFRGLDEPQSRGDGCHVIVYPARWAFTKFGKQAYTHREMVHGTYNIPPGYMFAAVPSNAEFKSEDPATQIELASYDSHVKTLVAIFQAVFASMTLYKARGDQVNRYGYAAFGLTVAPYAVMSMMNLLGNLCRCDYPCMYMIDSSTMDEARKRGGLFTGVVGRLDEEPQDNNFSCSSLIADVQPIAFSKDYYGRVIAHPLTPAPYGDCGETSTPHWSEKRPTLSSVPTDSQKWTVLDFPEKMNYAGTGNDAVLCIPSCNPIKLRTASSGYLAGPWGYTLSSVALKKTHIFTKCRTWKVAFEEPPFRDNSHLHWNVIKYTITTVVGFLPIMITGLLSHFQHGTAPRFQLNIYKTWTIQWMIAGAASGLGFVMDQEATESLAKPQRSARPLFRGAKYVTSAAPAVGGFIVVGMMLKDYGICTWMD